MKIKIYNMLFCKCKIYNFILGIFILAISLNSCKKQEEYPIEPYVEFKSFVKIPNTSGVDMEGNLTIEFTDGDSDIGLNKEDTLPPYNYGSEYYYNYYLFYYEKIDGEFVEVELENPFHSRIPYVDTDAPDRGIKGEIDIKVFFNNLNSPNDTIKFSGYIFDRELHKSNTFETPEIIVDKTVK